MSPARLHADGGDLAGGDQIIAGYAGTDENIYDQELIYQGYLVPADRLHASDTILKNCPNVSMRQYNQENCSVVVYKQSETLSSSKHDPNIWNVVIAPEVTWNELAARSVYGNSYWGELKEKFVTLINSRKPEKTEEEFKLDNPLMDQKTDIDLDYSFKVGKHFMLSPGVRMLWIKDDNTSGGQDKSEKFTIVGVKGHMDF